MTRMQMSPDDAAGCHISVSLLRRWAARDGASGARLRLRQRPVCVRAGLPLSSRGWRSASGGRSPPAGPAGRERSGGRDIDRFLACLVVCRASRRGVVVERFAIPAVVSSSCHSRIDVAVGTDFVLARVARCSLKSGSSGVLVFRRHRGMPAVCGPPAPPGQRLGADPLGGGRTSGPSLMTVRAACGTRRSQPTMALPLSW